MSLLIIRFNIKQKIYFYPNAHLSMLMSDQLIVVIFFFIRSYIAFNVTDIKNFMDRRPDYLSKSCANIASTFLDNSRHSEQNEKYQSALRTLATKEESSKISKKSS